MRLSIRSVLLIALIGLQIGAVTIALTFSHFRSDDAVHEQARTIMTDMTTSAIRRIEHFLLPAETTVELTQKLRQQNIISEENKPTLERYFFEQLRASPQISGFYYGDNTGKFIYVSRSSAVAEAQFRTKVMLRENSGASLMYRNDAFERIASDIDPEDRYDPRSRPWYQKVMQNAETTWTDPYIFYTSQMAGITVATPVLENGKIKGVLGIDMEIDALSDFLAELGNTGNVLVLGANGDVIAHPDKNKIKKLMTSGDSRLRFANISEIDDPAARAAVDSLGKPLGEVDFSTKQFTRFTIDGTTHDAMFSPFSIGNLNWAIAIYVAEEDFFGSLLAERDRIIALIIAAAAIAILFGWLIAKSITRPLTALSTFADQIAREEQPDTDSLPTNFVELNHVSTAFRRMTQWLDGYREKNERLNSELVAWSQELEGRVQERTSAMQEANSSLRIEIRERVEAEQRLAAEIERHRETATDLKWALTEAREASDAKTRFLSCMSHEIRTPLNAIIGFGQMLDGRVGELDETKRQEYAEHITDSGERLLGMINQVLDLAGIEAGNTKMSIEAVSVRGVIKRVMNELGVLAQQRSVDLVNEAEDLKFSYVSADEARMTQSLVNLVSNAIKYNRDGGDVRVSAETLEASVRISVSDTGRGIPRDRQKEVFETFNRLGVESSQIEGSGVGLSLTKEFIEMMDGKIGFESVEGKGSTFWIELPIFNEDEMDGDNTVTL